MRRPALILLPVALAAFGLGAASGSSLTVTTKLLSAYRTCVLSGISSSSTEDADTHIRQDSSSNNYGSNANMFVKSLSGGSNRRAFIRFDLTLCSPSISSTATVKLATLRLYVNGVPNATRTYEAHQVISPCPEGLSTCWGEGTLTWNNQPGAAASATSTISVCSTAGCNNQYYSFTVTPDVATFVAGTTVNYGWRITDSVESSTTSQQVTFGAKENNSTTQAPQLVIVYAP